MFAEPAAAAAYAGLLKMIDAGAIGSDERVLVMLTGNGLKDTDAARGALEQPLRVRPDFDELTRLLSITR